MAPVKFDDVPKAATEVLNDDYQCSGFAFKAKQKTTLGGAVATTAVDLWPGKGDVQTPGKITWKFPKPFGLSGVSIDKLEVDKAGKLKLEVSADKAAHKVADLKVETKSDLEDPMKATVGVTYTGLKNAHLKIDTKALTPQDFTAEASYKIDVATVSTKFTLKTLTAPDLGARVEYGPAIVSLMAKHKLSVFTASACFKAHANTKLACTYEHGGKSSGNFGVGLVHKLEQGTQLKAKVTQDGTVHGSVKHDLAKGFTVTKGFKYAKSGDFSWGLALSVE